MTNKPKIIFFGTPEFAAIVLEKMIEADYRPIAVITAPDKPVGRKQILTPSATKLLAIKYNIQILQPEVLSISNFQFPISNLKPDLIVLAAYGQIIPKEILEIPKYGCLNIHPSLLPKYRGASPIQAAILNGDKETGVTIMLMDEKMDYGPIVAQRQLEFSIFNFQFSKLNQQLARLGAELLIETLPKWLAGKIKPVPQDHSKAIYTKIIKKEDGHIDWNNSAEYIERMIRAYNPWPTTYTEFRIKNIEYRKLKIIKASVLKIEHRKKPGTVFLIHSAISVSTSSKVEGLTENNPELRRVRGYPAPYVVQGKELAIACGQDALILIEVQPEGKRPMMAKEFLNGYPWIIGSVLS